MNTIYKTKVTATGGRNGQVKSEDGLINLEVRIPKEMGGTGGEYTNPEQLFAAGYSACFDSALNYVARMQKIKISDTKVHATVGLAKAETEGFNLLVTLDVEIPNLERDIALKLLETAHTVCPYSRATKNNIDVTINLI